MTEQDLSIKTDVEILKRDVSSINQVLEKLDSAIDKIAEVSSGINQILAVHETKQEATEKDIEIVHQRITDGERELKKDLDEFHSKLDRLISAMDKRIAILEKWKWYIMGTAWGFGFLIATFLQAGNFISILQ